MNNEASQPKDSTKEEDQMQDFVSKAFQTPWQKALAEQLICQHLAQATYSHKPETVIYHTCAAALMYAKANPNKKVEDLDLDLLKRLMKVHQALTNPCILPWKHWLNNYVYEDRKAYRVLWGFPTDNESFCQFIQPWLQGGFAFWSQFIKLNREWRVHVTCSCGAVLFDESKSKVETDHINIEKWLKEKHGVKKTRRIKREPRSGEITELYDAWDSRCRQKYGYDTSAYLAALLKGPPSLVDDWSGFDRVPLVIENKEYLVVKCAKCGFEAPAEEWKSCLYETVMQDPYWKFFFEATRNLTVDGYTSLVNQLTNYATPIIHDARALLCTLMSPNVLTDVLASFTKKQKPSEEESAFESDMETGRRDT